jgi:hypothetical protein
MSHRPTLRRRDLLLGALGTSVAGCIPALPRWKPTFADTGWHNVIYTRCIDPDRQVTAHSLAEVVQLVKDAEAAGERLRAVGAGHSFSDVAVTDGWVLRTLELARPIPVARDRLKAHCRGDKLFSVEGGIRLRDLSALLDKEHLALPTMGGWNMQTLAGVISTSTHGSGLDYGPFPSLVASLVMVASGGRVLQIEPTDGITDPAAFGGVVMTPSGSFPGTLVQDDETFNAAVVAMGSMGIIYSATIRVDDAFWLRESRELSTWDALIAPGGFLDVLVNTGRPPADADGKVPDYYELLFNPYAVDGQYACAVTRRHRIPVKAHAADDCGSRPAGETFFGSIEKDAPFLLPDVLHDDPEGAGNVLQLGVRGVKSACYEAVSYDVFNSGKVNELMAYSAELAIDLPHAITAIQRVFDVSRNKLKIRSGVHSAPISIRFVKACDALLSPQNGRPTCMIEIFTLAGVLGTNGLLLDHERDLMDLLGARPHWGLDLRAIEGWDRVKKLYPQTAERWRAKYALANASGVFNGELTDRLGISMPIDGVSNVAKRRSYECVPLRTR